MRPCTWRLGCKSPPQERPLKLAVADGELMDCWPIMVTPTPRDLPQFTREGVGGYQRRQQRHHGCDHLIGRESRERRHASTRVIRRAAKMPTRAYAEAADALLAPFTTISNLLHISAAGEHKTLAFAHHARNRTRWSSASGIEWLRSVLATSMDVVVDDTSDALRAHLGQVWPALRPGGVFMFPLQPHIGGVMAWLNGSRSVRGHISTATRTTTIMAPGPERITLRRLRQNCASACHRLLESYFARPAGAPSRSLGRATALDRRPLCMDVLAAGMVRSRLRRALHGPGTTHGRHRHLHGRWSGGEAGERQDLDELVPDHLRQPPHAVHAPAGRRLKMLEIGLGCDEAYGPGASVSLWQRHFTPVKLELWEGEFNAKCVARSIANGKLKGVGTVTGDQGNATVLRRWLDETHAAEPDQAFDIVIDDGGHQNTHTVTTFAHFWPVVRPGGMYFIEDLHVARMSHYEDTNGTNISTDLLRGWMEQQLAGASAPMQLPGGRKDQSPQAASWYTKRPPFDGIRKLPEGTSFIACQTRTCALGKGPR